MLTAQSLPGTSAIDGEVGRVLARTHANGLAIAVVDHGRVGYVQFFGIRDAKGDPLTTDTIMYGASLTKTVFAYTLMQLADQGRIKLDTPIADDLDDPLPNDVRAGAGYGELVRFILGDTGVPYDWEYATYAGKS